MVSPKPPERRDSNALSSPRKNRMVQRDAASDGYEEEQVEESAADAPDSD